MGMGILLIGFAIAVMILFIPVAIGVGIKIIATDWYIANRRTLIIGLGALEIALLAAICVVFFGLAV
ncbi:hypothetical protein MNBD_ALPHA04-803 [hydrothermal vent metagenome]|uniref:Uncharacterized protein n=1 Tax=hydrothermal vent metagenome TaxID=652676 RepID=A0A3B0S921_9ZZZZ